VPSKLGKKVARSSTSTTVASGLLSIGVHLTQRSCQLSVLQQVGDVWFIAQSSGRDVTDDWWGCKTSWVSCKSGFFLPVRVLSRLFRRLYLEKLYQAHQQHSLLFFGNDEPLEDEELFAQWLTPLRKKEWIVYAKRPFPGPKAVFAYLSRYTHRVAISNSRLVKSDSNNVTFRCKNYRAKASVRYRTMTLDNGEFIRRFLLA